MKPIIPLKMLVYLILTPFSKFEIKSDKAHQELQKICTANIKNEVGKCTYTHMLKY